MSSAARDVSPDFLAGCDNIMPSKYLIGVDFDRTLAEYTYFEGNTTLGKPIPAMVERVKGWLKKGYTVVLITARLSPHQDYTKEDYLEIRQALKDWCKEHIGQELLMTSIKVYGLDCLYDDIACAIEPNTGRILGGRQVR